MKAKQLFCVSLTAVMALSCGLFAACGDKDEKGGTAPTYATSVPDKLYNNGSLTTEGRGMTSTHDPVVVEAKRNGVSEFYAFSTDNDQYGVQIRKSTNLYEWERVGVAIDGYTTSTKAPDVKSIPAIQEVYGIVSKYGTWKNDCWTLWAPDVVPATSNTTHDAEGEWWLYSCWTAAFGSSQSVIFKLKSQDITGPYTYEGVIVRDNSSGINEIDPSIYYTPDGRMFMSYGSFSKGFATIELDPTTGLRLDGEEDTNPGKNILVTNSAEGSVINYHTVDVYTGDIVTEDYDASKWEKQSKYYMMGSWGALAYNYNMRVWTSDTPDGVFTSERGVSGLQVSGTWTWRKDGEGAADGTASLYPAGSKELNFFIPGHNDMLTTTGGVNVIAYHTRVAEGTKDGNPSYAEGEHFLYTSMYDFNAKGQLVINPNRYVGEKIGTVKASDLLSKTNGLYSAVTITSANVGYTTKSPIAHPVDLQLNNDGTLTVGDQTGSWKVYGDHYIWLKIGDLNYYGSVMPAQIRQYDAAFNSFYANNGLTISAISDVYENAAGGQENNILYLNMQFSI